MKITICGSMAFAKDFLDAKTRLERAGHTCFIPEGTEEYAKNAVKKVGGGEGAKRKVAKDLIRRHYNLIQDSDAILVVNNDKGSLRNYIGGNTFLELGFAHVLNKKIYLLKEAPDLELIRQEIDAMQPEVIHGDLSKII